jgi:hypothetical protein
VPIYIKLPFISDRASDTVTHRLASSLQKTFYAAQLRIHFSSTRLLNTNLKDRMPVHDSSMLIYSFVCECSANYVGRTTRRLSQRIAEHVPSRLRTGQANHMTSAIAAHLIDTNHCIDPAKAFSIIYHVPANRCKAVRQSALATAEAIAIRLKQPSLCHQKRHVKALTLPWPSNHPSTPNFNQLT